jgi:putative endonuclease
VVREPYAQCVREGGCEASPYSMPPACQAFDQNAILRMPYYVYILKSLKDKTFYVGSTQNLESRLKRHNAGRVASTKSRRFWKLVYSEEHPTRSGATKRETEIKSHKRRAYIEALIQKS